MACDFIDNGRLEPCRDSVGGIKEVYFVQFGTLGGYTDTDDVLDTFTDSPTAYRYEVRGNSSFTQNIQSSDETGTTAFEQVVELTLKKLSADDHKKVKLLAHGRPHVIVKDQNDNFFLAGLDNGLVVTGGTIVTGAAMSELSGYTLTFTGMEKVPANFIDDTTLAGAGFTVPTVS